MSSDQLVAILSSIATLVILPLLIDWIKRRWDYNANVSKSRFEVLSELNSLIWSYHAITGRLYQTSAFMRESVPSDNEIDEITKRFVVASDALYSGLYSCRSRIHQHFDENHGIDLALDDLRDWAFHGDNCPDNSYLRILHSLAEKNKEKADLERKALDDNDATSRFGVKVDSILQPLAKQLREMSSLWYPLNRQFRRIFLHR